MASERLSDAGAKTALKKWPQWTSKLWEPPGGVGRWLQGQPRRGKAAGPFLSTPGAQIFTTQPDGLWFHFQGFRSCDVVVIESCGTAQNLNDKRVRYIPASHSLVLNVSKAWLQEEIQFKKGMRPRWQVAATLKKSPKADLHIPVRVLRVLYTLPNKMFHTWCPHHVPTGYEFFCPHSSLGTYGSPKMQTFLRQMSFAAQFYVRIKPCEAS